MKRRHPVVEPIAQAISDIARSVNSPVPSETAYDRYSYIIFPHGHRLAGETWIFEVHSEELVEQVADEGSAERWIHEQAIAEAGAEEDDIPPWSYDDWAYAMLTDRQAAARYHIEEEANERDVP